MIQYVTSCVAELPSGCHVGGALKGFWAQLEGFPILCRGLFTLLPFGFRWAGLQRGRRRLRQQILWIGAVHWWTRNASYCLVMIRSYLELVWLKKWNLSYSTAKNFQSRPAYKKIQVKKTVKQKCCLTFIRSLPVFLPGGAESFGSHLWNRKPVCTQHPRWGSCSLIGYQCPCDKVICSKVQVKLAQCYSSSLFLCCLWLRLTKCNRWKHLVKNFILESGGLGHWWTVQPHSTAQWQTPTGC